MAKLNSFIDHTNLKPSAVKADIKKLCKEALNNRFASVCINSSYVSYAKQLLKNSDVKVCAVAGFPLGACMSSVKAFEAAEAVKAGAEEIDMVINVGFLKDGRYDEVLEDIRGVVAASCGCSVKVIIETCLLTDEEKVKACELAEQAGADFVKTSTGFSTGGATVEDVELMRNSVTPKVRVKAAGGIRDYETAFAMVNAGADRLGTSQSLAICKE